MRRTLTYEYCSCHNRRPVLWMLCIKLLAVRCIFVWNGAWRWSYGFVPRTCSCKFDAATNSCLSAILVWYSIQRQLNVMSLNVKYSCIVWVPTLCVCLATISDCLQPHGIVQGLLRLVMRSFLVNRRYSSTRESVLLCVACMTTNWDISNTARNFGLRNWNEDFQKERHLYCECNYLDKRAFLAKMKEKGVGGRGGMRWRKHNRGLVDLLEAYKIR